MKYIDIRDYLQDGYTFNIFIGGRGTGKTFSAIDLILHECKEGSQVMYMRRTDTECKLIESSADNPDINPFADVTIKQGYDYVVDIERINKAMCKLSVGASTIGYMVALSVIANVRGLSFRNVDTIVFDEFIPERHVKKMKDEAIAFFNAYETTNRNRELADMPPVRAILLANSNDIYNNLFEELDVIYDIERAMSKGVHSLYYEERGLAIHLLEASEDFINAKKNTALYRLTKGSRYYDMALNNKFAFNDFSLIGSRNLKEYRPLASYGKAYIYMHKSRDEIYVSYSKSKCVHYNSDNDYDKRGFYSDIGCKLSIYYRTGNIIFQSYELKTIILDNIL